MTLSFSTKWPKHMGEWAGQPNWFIQKIWKVLISNLGDQFDNVLYQEKHKTKFGHYWRPNYDDVLPKLHTLRHDPHGRWKPGMKIHPVINNRSPQRFQFAPTMICTGIQYVHVEHNGQGRAVCVGNNPDYSDCAPIYFEDDDNDTVHGQNEMEVLALNDGFESVDQFFAFFKEDFRGKIIHWANLDILNFMDSSLCTIFSNAVGCSSLSVNTNARLRISFRSTFSARDNASKSEILYCSFKSKARSLTLCFSKS